MSPQKGGSGKEILANFPFPASFLRIQTCLRFIELVLYFL